MRARIRPFVLATAATCLKVAAAGAGDYRVCDGSWRHLTCRFQGGFEIKHDVPPGETLSYGPITAAFTDRGTVHIILQGCEIVCLPEGKHP